MAQFLGEFLEAIKNRKYESYNSLISVHRTASYNRFGLCKKTQEKRPIGREIPISPITSVEKGGFRKMGKRGPRENLPKMAQFFSKLRKAKKIGNTSPIIA